VASVIVVEDVPVGARFVDSIDGWGLAKNAAGLVAAGFHGAFLYLEQATPGMIAGVLGGGLGVCFYSYADDFDPVRAVRELRICGVPSQPGPTVADDLESFFAGATQCASELRASAAGRIAAGYLDPGLYVGANQPLDARGLGALPHSRYIKSASAVPMPVFAGVDRGWSLVQELPFNQLIAGVRVDVSRARTDAIGRSLRWMIKR
jgi:hypothetical protein